MNGYNTKVSIIVPVYNVEKLLDRCMLSIINQTYMNLEIILVDDGSQDLSGERCDYYSRIDSRVIVIHKANGGLSDARNWGIEKASGEYIMFIDSDDYVDRDSVKVLVEFAVLNNLDIVCADAIRIVESEGKEKKERLIGDKHSGKVISGEEYLVNSIKEKNYAVAVWTRLYKTALIKNNNILFKKGIYHEDEEWTPRVMLKAKRVSYIDYPFYFYIIRSGSITQTGNRNKHVKDVIETCEILMQYFEKNVCKKDNRNILKNYLAKLYINTSTYGNYDENYYKSVIHRSFPLKNAHYLLTRTQALIYVINPSIYRKLKLFYLKNLFKGT